MRQAFECARCGARFNSSRCDCRNHHYCKCCGTYWAEGLCEDCDLCLKCCECERCEYCSELKSNCDCKKEG